MSSGELVARLVTGVGSVLQDLGDALNDDGALEGLVSDLGATLEQGATAAQVQALLGSLPGDLEALTQAVQAVDLTAGAAALLAATANVVAALAKVVEDGHQLASGPPPTSTAPFNDPSFWARFFDDAFALLAYDALRQNAPGAYALLRAMGVAVENDAATGGALRAIQWDHIPTALSNPLSTLSTAYGWGTQLDVSALLDAVGDASDALGLTVTIEDPAGVAAACWGAIAADPNQVVPFVRTSLFRAAGATSDSGTGLLASIDVGVEVVPIPDATQQGPSVGVAIALDVEGTLADQLTLAPGITLQASAGGDVAVRVELRPIGASLVPPSGVTGAAESTLQLAAQPPQPWILGDPGSTRLEIDSLALSASATVSTSGPPEATAGISTKGSAVLDLGDADGFIQTVLGSGDLTAQLNGSLTWSSINGLRLMGGAGLSGNVPLNIDIGGVLQLNEASAQVMPQGSGAQLTLGVSGALALGVLTASVDTVGLSISVLTVPKTQPPGNLGPLDVAFGFSPPHGLGLDIDAGPVTGGGYASFDQQHGRYAGALQLALESLSLTAIGLIQTKNADGSPMSDGFSLVVMIDVTFLPGIELGFGFSLNGVGGLLGLNRTTNVDALRSGVRSGSIADIMFPTDPIGNAPQIIQELEGFFPLAPGRFLIGPMVQIDWGSPLPIFRAELGVLIELPAPIVIAILGVLQVALPEPGDDAIVEINLDALGVLDLGQGEFSLDASLYDSRVVEFTITGDMAMRLGWKADREFLISIGGFHPAYTPPPGFPTLSRLAISLSSGDNPTFSLQCYFAVTSNTLQFGAKAQLAVDAGPASLAGMMSFDVLIHLNPFGFEFDFAASLTIKVDGQELLGISVSGKISGPAPWYITGQATITLLFLSVSVSFNCTLGSASPPPAPPPTRVIDLVAADVANPVNWSALPPAGDMVVTLVPAPTTGATMRAHPLGSLSFSQHTVPLGLELQKFGSTAVAGPAKLGLTGVTYGATGVTPTEVDDAFAPAQFLELSDSDALSQPSFVTYQSGIAFAPTGPDLDQLAVGDAASVQYTIDLIDSQGTSPAATTWTMDGQAAQRLLPTAPAAFAPTRRTGANRYQGTAGTIAVAAPGTATPGAQS